MQTNIPSSRNKHRTDKHSHQSTTFTSNRLESLAEQDDIPATNTTTNAAPQSSPLPQTPSTSRPKPVHEEMHPSKAQQSTAKQPDSGLRFGFADISTVAEQQTPTKSAVKSAFTFRHAHPGPQLSADAQNMLDDLREESMRVKARLIAEREETARNAQVEADAALIAGRKIAQAKGKVGRFSDVHMAEFRKMDSIADHPSSFRAHPPKVSTPLKPALKRSQSQARLEDTEETTKEQAPPTKFSTPLKSALKRSQSQAKLVEREDIVKQQVPPKFISERLENDAPAKRVRKAISDDASSARPVSRSGIPTTPRRQTSFLTAITTPTQSSIARATVTKPASQIPALARSSSRPNLTIPTPAPHTPKLSKSSSISSLQAVSKAQSGPVKFVGAPQSEPRLQIKSPGKVDRLKSMLRYSSFSARKPSSLPTAASESRFMPRKPEVDKQLPALPSTPGGQETNRTAKHVSFTPDIVKKHSTSVAQSPSPTKSAIPRSTMKPGIFTKALTPKQPVFRGTKSIEVSYPSLAGHPSLDDESDMTNESSTRGLTRSLPPPPSLTKKHSHPPPPSVPGTFTFRSDHTIDFGRSPEGFGSSPGQSSVRQVRPSIFPEMPGAFPSANKENDAPFSSVAHGLSNKKRHRAEFEDVSREVENSSKKVKTDFTYGFHAKGPAIEAPKVAATPATPSPAKKKGLSMSRLNMLSRPKQRK